MQSISGERPRLPGGGGGTGGVPEKEVFPEPDGTPQTAEKPKETVIEDKYAKAWSEASQEVKQALSWLHKNMGHANVRVLRKMIQMAGGTKEAAGAVLGMPCEVCDSEKKHRFPGAARPPRAWQFNELVQRDVMFWSHFDGPEKQHEEKFAALVITDVATRFTVGVMIPKERISNFDGELLAQLVAMAWLSWADRPAEFEYDIAGEHKSKAFQEFCEQSNVVGVPVPSEAHEKLAPVDLRIQFVKEMIASLA